MAQQQLLFVQSANRRRRLTPRAARGRPTYNYAYASYIDEPVHEGGRGITVHHRNNSTVYRTDPDGSGAIPKNATPTRPHTEHLRSQRRRNRRTTSAEEQPYSYTGREF